MHLVNIYGSNGTGKSTRVFHLYKYLESKFSKHPMYFDCKDKKSGKYIKQQCGYVFENGWAIFGKESKGGEGWIGGDTALLPTHEDRFKFFREANQYNKEINFDIDIKTVVFESYFNSRGPKFSPDNFRDVCPNVTTCDFIILYYDDIQEFIKRTNNRTNQDRGLDWAENSAGWRDNQDREAMYYRCVENNSNGDFVKRLDINEPRDWLIKHYFDDSFVYDPPKKNQLF